MTNKITPIEFGKRDSINLLNKVIEENPHEVVICYTKKEKGEMYISYSVSSVSELTGKMFIMMAEISKSDE